MKRMKMLPVLAGLLFCSALLFTTCDAIKDLIAGTSAVGVYVGVFSYDGTDKVKDLVKDKQNDVQVSLGNPSLAYLSDDNNTRIQQYVLPAYTQGNTTGRALMYAIKKVIKNIKDSEDSLNNKLDNVTIVSISNGVDQVSVDLGDFENVESCGADLKTLIDTETIRNKPINAYSVILSPTDNPLDDIKQTAQWITSGVGEWGDNPFIIRAANLSLDTLQPIFEKIATGLPGIQTSKLVTITINGPGNISAQYKDDPDECNFCAVFNGKTPTDSDAVYIKGFIQRVEGNYVISSIKYKGITGTVPEKVEASGKNGTRFNFNFPGVEGTTSSIDQYKYDGTSWSQMSGANMNNEEIVTVIPAEKKTAIVVLILDASLPSSDINSVRSAASAFVNKLYEQSQK